MKLILKILPYVLLFVAILLLIEECQKEPEYIEVPTTIYVPVPVIKHEFDTIYKPKIVKEKQIDSAYYERYVNLKDSIQKDSAYKDAITIREYNTEFKDTVLTAKVFNRVRGSLLATQLSYETNPDLKIRYDTIFRKEKIRDPFDLAIEGGVGLPRSLESSSLILKLGLDVRIGKTKLGLEYDSEDTKWFTMGRVIF